MPATKKEIGGQDNWMDTYMRQLAERNAAYAQQHKEEAEKPAEKRGRGRPARK